MADSEERIEDRPAAPAPEGEDGDAVTGPEAIARYVKHLGSGPGVYRMLDKAGEVIYVGKARNLKNRVQNYAQLAGHNNRIAAMIRSTVSMEFMNTATEAEALLLEANLIKRFKPRYNVSFRDDKSFPYIVIRRDQEAPQIAKHRGARTLKGDYFGPFASAGAVNRTINTLQRAFLLRSCSDSVYESRTRPCLLFQIKRCSAPCTREISLEDYAKLVDEAETFLSRQDRRGAEKAQRAHGGGGGKARIRARREISQPALGAGAYPGASGHQPAAASRKPTCSRSRRRAGRPAFRSSSSAAARTGATAPISRARTASLSEGEVLGSFISQFYDDKIVPRCVLLSCEVPEQALIAEALSTKLGQQGGGADAEARREAGAGGPRSPECQGGARPQARGKFEPGQALGRRWRGFRAGAHAAPHRGLRQFAHHGHERGGRDDRRGAGRLREEPVPQVQYQDRRAYARR